MNKKQSILVIDDEDVICESFNRILTKEGFSVDLQTQPKKGLAWAVSKNYDLVLLDLKMEEMDGIDLIHDLRDVKPDLPVIIVTGYPTMETAIESVKLGISNYILKPFTPEEIIYSVKKAIQGEQKLLLKKEKKSPAPMPETFTWTPSDKQIRFYESTWFQQGNDNSVRVGAQIPYFKDLKIKHINIPKINDTVYAGFPLAEILFENDKKYTIQSPVTGKVVFQNQKLLKDPDLIVYNNFISHCWIAIIQPTNLAKELSNCQIRRVYFFSGAEKEKKELITPLSNLGCDVIQLNAFDKVLKEFKNDNEKKILILDGSSLSAKGPEYVSRINIEFPRTKIVIIDKQNSRLEDAYRKNRIFYYCVRSLFNNEVADIVNSVFTSVPPEVKIKSNESSFLPQLINRIKIINKHGNKVTLLSFDDLLYNNQVTGHILINKLLKKAFPIEVTRGIKPHRLEDPLSNQKILQEKDKNNLLIILSKKDLNKIPGQLKREAQSYTNSKGIVNKIIKLSIQPDPSIKDPETSLDMTTCKTLADFLFNEMVTYKD